MLGLRATDAGVLWAAALAGPEAWAVQLLAVYALAAPASEGMSEAPLHLVTLLGFVAAVGGAAVAHLGWRTVRGWPSGGDEIDTGRTRFMAVVGQLTGALFALVIVAHWFAVLMLPARPTGTP